jgi:hypothetical protein
MCSSDYVIIRDYCSPADVKIELFQARLVWSFLDSNVHATYDPSSISKSFGSRAALGQNHGKRREQEDEPERLHLETPNEQMFFSSSLLFTSNVNVFCYLQLNRGNLCRSQIFAAFSACYLNQIKKRIKVFLKIVYCMNGTTSISQTEFHFDWIS